MTSREELEDGQRLRKRLHWLGKRLNQAQKRWNLIEDGDRILLGLSGGKDSLALLHLLLAWRETAPVDFDLRALHVELEGTDCAGQQRETLAAHAAALDVPLTVVRSEVDLSPADGRATHPCFRCARKRRELLFRHAEREGCGKVALAHHLDDAAETVLMNLLFKGGLDGLRARREFFDGRIVLIRPLILAEEKEIADLASLIDFPTTTCFCPANDASQRQRMKQFLANFGHEAATAKRHLWRISCEEGRQDP